MKINKISHIIVLIIYWFRWCVATSSLEFVELWQIQEKREISE